jgi:hypothetical protein
LAKEQKIINAVGMMYTFDSTDAVEDAVVGAINQFSGRFGYLPDGVYINRTLEGDIPVPVHMAENVPDFHFVLIPVVDKRSPVVVVVERSPV